MKYVDTQFVMEATNAFKFCLPHYLVISFVCFVLWMELLSCMRTSCTTSGFSFTLGKDVKKDLEEQTRQFCKQQLLNFRCKFGTTPAVVNKALHAC